MASSPGPWNSPYPHLHVYGAKGNRRRGRRRARAAFRACGAVCLVRVGAGSSTTQTARVETSGNQGEPKEITRTASQSASMADSEKATLHQARAGDGPELVETGPSQRGDADCRQSFSRVVIRRRRRSGVAMETRTG